MPNVNDIANLAEALAKHPIVVVGDRCLAVRNRNSTCRKCVHACPFSAIAVEANEVSLDPSACVGCGACAVVCPSEALIAANAPDSALAKLAADALRECGTLGVVACARISSKQIGDPLKYVEVPCLSRVDESLLMSLAAEGAQRIVLVDGNCKTCKHRDCTAGLDETVEQVRAMAACSGSDFAVERSSEFPEELVIEDATGRFGSTRRGFFSEAFGAARETAMVAAKTTLEQELGMKPEQLAIGDRLRVTSSGNLPVIATPRHERLLNSFDALGEPRGERLESRRFATVSIVAGKCNSCGMCAVFCPTGALRRSPSEKPSDPIDYIEFSAAECIGCRMCKDVCWKGALDYEPGISIDQLYDFDPVRFDLPRSKKTSLFGASKF